MKAIINGLLYDTAEAKIGFEDDCGVFTVYKTKDNRIFMTNNIADTIETDTDKIKETLGSLSPDGYIEIFGEVEEA